LAKQGAEVIELAVMQIAPSDAVKAADPQSGHSAAAPGPGSGLGDPDLKLMLRVVSLADYGRPIAICTAAALRIAEYFEEPQSADTVAAEAGLNANALRLPVTKVPTISAANRNSLRLRGECAKLLIALADTLDHDDG
jgi:hypothetical protein